MEIQLGQWVVVVNPGYVDSGIEPGYVGRLVVLDHEVARAQLGQLEGL